jgi:hypothetical protein
MAPFVTKLRLSFASDDTVFDTATNLEGHEGLKI